MHGPWRPSRPWCRVRKNVENRFFEAIPTASMASGKNPTINRQPVKISYIERAGLGAEEGRTQPVITGSSGEIWGVEGGSTQPVITGSSGETAITVEGVRRVGRRSRRG